MHREEWRSDLGTVRIHDNVIASIASLAACEIEGVRGIEKSFKSTISELISKKRISSIKVQKDKNQEISIEVPLVVKYGFNIPEIANKAQENIRLSLEKMTNLSIKDVNIIVGAIEKEEEKK